MNMVWQYVGFGLVCFGFAATVWVFDRSYGNAERETVADLELIGAYARDGWGETLQEIRDLPEVA